MVDIHIKVTPLKDGLCLVALIQKKDEDNFLLFNERYEIQNMGKSFYSLISKNAEKVPGRIIFQQMNKIV